MRDRSRHDRPLRRATMRYGFIGLGHLGAPPRRQPRARRLRPHGQRPRPGRGRVACWPPARLGRPADGSSPSEADAVITCLPSPTATEAVLAGATAAAGLRPGGAWIEMSTNGRDEIRRLAAAAASKGIATLECAGHRRRAPGRDRRDHRARRRRRGAVRAATGRRSQAMGGEISTWDRSARPR